MLSAVRKSPVERSATGGAVSWPSGRPTRPHRRQLEPKGVQEMIDAEAVKERIQWYRDLAGDLERNANFFANTAHDFEDFIARGSSTVETILALITGDGMADYMMDESHFIRLAYREASVDQRAALDLVFGLLCGLPLGAILHHTPAKNDDWISETQASATDTRAATISKEVRNV
jgi:hypothetical protein